MSSACGHAWHTEPSSKWSKSEAEIQTDTDDFLPPLRRLSLPPPANSHAKPACSNTLTEAGYAHSDNENRPTVSLCGFSLPVSV